MSGAAKAFWSLRLLYRILIGKSHLALVAPILVEGLAVIDRLLNPRSVAIIGASTSVAKMGGLVTLNVRAGGYRGAVYPVNPRAEKVHGYKAYRSIRDTPQPDLAAVLVPRHLVAGVVEECGESGVDNVIVMTGGFKEVGEEGAKAEEELVRIARRYGMNLVGPNCVGVSLPWIQLNLTTMPCLPPAGPVAMISQSGAFAVQNFLSIGRWGLGFSAVISTGNEAVLTCTDYLELLAKDRSTRVILLYVEGIKDGARFVEAAQRVSLKKPVLLMKVGRTMEGRRAAASHTGALAGEQGVFLGAMRQAGVLVGGSLEELFDWAAALAGQELPRGRRMAILTNSGGPGVSLSDVCSELGLEVPELPDQVQKRLLDMLPPTAVAYNPVDSTFTIDMGIFSRCAGLLLALPGIDGLIIHGFFGPSLLDQFNRLPEIPRELVEEMHREYMAAADQLVETVRRHGKPVLLSSTQDRGDPAIRRLQEAGIPVYPAPERAARSMAALVRYAEWVSSRPQRSKS